MIFPDAITLAGSGAITGLLGRLDGFKQVAAFVAALPRGQGLRYLSARARMVPTATKYPASFPAG